jgi:hypothetical protein
LHPEIEKVHFEEIEKQANRFYFLAIREEIGFDDNYNMTLTKSAVKNDLFF